MSVTLLAWFAVLLAAAAAAFVRRMFGFSVYILTFFMLPSMWWWGKGIGGYRWNLFAGVFFLAVALVDRVARPSRWASEARFVDLAAIAMVVNATFVHYVLAPDPEISIENYVLLSKFVLLYVLIRTTLQDRQDLRIVLWSITLGAAYIGWEVTINDRGSMSGGRLEGIGAAGVRNANELASLFVTLLPLAGSLFFTGRPWEKALVVVAAPLILNVILLANSRGAFLAGLCAVVVFMVTAGRVARKRAFKALALASLSLVFLLKDPQIVERFLTVFVSAEERDNSAASRLLFWHAASLMILDHPLGAGGDGFAKVYSGEYLPRVGLDLKSRATHNGFINEATEWGVQGLALKVVFFVGALIVIRRARQRTRDPDLALFGACLNGSITAFLGTCVFGDYLEQEWGFWVVGIAIAFHRLCETTSDVAGDSRDTAAPLRLRRPAPTSSPSATGDQPRVAARSSGRAASAAAFFAAPPVKRPR